MIRDYMPPLCINPQLIRNAVSTLYAAALAAATAYLASIAFDVPTSTTMLLAGFYASSLAAAAAILHYATDSWWSLLSLALPLAGVAVYKSAEKSWGCSDSDCAAIAYASLLAPILAPIAAWLCLGIPRCAARRKP